MFINGKRGIIMILGIGIDIVSVKRMNKALASPAFAQKVFTTAELEYIGSSDEHAAGFFAAKEALVKALGTGFGHIKVNEMEIRHNSKGIPFFVLYNNAGQAVKRLGSTNIMLSISHERDFAVAFVVIEGREMS